MQDLGTKEAFSLLLISCATVAKATEMSEVIPRPHCSDCSCSGVHSTGTKLLFAEVLGKVEAKSSKMQLVEDSRKKVHSITFASLLLVFTLADMLFMQYERPIHV